MYDDIQATLAELQAKGWRYAEMTESGLRNSSPRFRLPDR